MADVACTGTALRDFKRMTDGASFTEDEVAPYDSESAASAEGVREFVPTRLSLRPAPALTGAGAGPGDGGEGRVAGSGGPAAGRSASALQRQVDRPLQLRVAARRLVLRRDHHLDVRVDTVVLDVPAGVVEPDAYRGWVTRVPSTSR